MTVQSKTSEKTEKTTPKSNKRLLYWAAGLSIGSVIAHAIDAPDHLTEWWGYSTFFITVAAFQFFYGFGLLLQPWRYDDTGAERTNSEGYGQPYYILGIVLTGSIIVVYIITRTAGMPFFGPGAVVERVTGLSLVPVAENIPLLYCLARLLRLSSLSKMRQKTEK